MASTVVPRRTVTVILRMPLELLDRDFCPQTLGSFRVELDQASLGQLISLFAYQRRRPVVVPTEQWRLMPVEDIATATHDQRLLPG